MIKIFALNNNYSYNIVILTVFNYLHSVSTSLSSNEMASNCDIDRVTHAIIQQRIRLALASAIYVHYFLPMRPVYTSSRTGNRYTEEIIRAHPRRVIDLIRMTITTLLDLRDWVVDRALLESTRVISIEEQLIMYLWIIGRGATTREAAEQFQHSTQTISQ